MDTKEIPLIMYPINNEFEEYDKLVVDTLRMKMQCSLSDASEMTATHENIVNAGFNNKTDPDRIALDVFEKTSPCLRSCVDE